MLYNTTNAFVGHLVKKFDINLEDFNSFNNNVIAVISSLNNGFVDCSRYSFSDYGKFICKGSLYLDIEKNKTSIEYLNQSIEKLEDIKEELNEMLGMQMRVIYDKRLINSQESPTKYEIMSGFVNSAYSEHNVPITLDGFINVLINNKKKYLNDLSYYVNMSEQEIQEELCYVREDVDRLVEIFYNKGDLKGINQMYNVKENLKTFNNAIVCLVYSVYKSLQGFNEDEFDEVMPYVIKSVLDYMCDTLS